MCCMHEVISTTSMTKHLNFLQQYNKEYETKMEELERQAIWTTHRIYVEMHNKNADLYGFTTGMNEYADLVSDQCVFD